MVKIKKTWATAYFTASKKGLNPVTIEVTINYDKKEYNICTSNEESVSFANDSIPISELKLEALQSAIKYIKAEFEA
jgi:hypothetical protein